MAELIESKGEVESPPNGILPNPDHTRHRSRPGLAILRPTMDFNFTGSSRPQRTINLGGNSQPKSVADIAAQARAARANRHQQRQQVLAATRLQSLYRAHRSSRAWRRKCAQEFDEISSRVSDQETWIHVTRLAVFCQTPDTHEHISRLVAWAHMAMQTNVWTETALWKTLFSLALRKSLQALSSGALSHEDAHALFALVLHTLSGDHGELQRWFVHGTLKHNLYHSLRVYFLSLSKTAFTEQALCVDAFLRPMCLFPGPINGFAEDPTDPIAPPRALCLSGFVKEVISIPNLLQSMPITSVTQFSASLPVDDVLQQISTLGTYFDVSTGDSALASNPIHCPYLLANLMPLVSIRVKSMTGRQLAQYLEVLTVLQNAMDRTVFVERSMTSAQAFSQLATLVSHNHLRSVLAASNKYAVTSRPALFAFLVATTQAWPPHVAEDVLLSVLYGFDTQPSSTNVPFGAVARELWRGWVRSSALSRTINAPGHNMVYYADEMRKQIVNPSFATEWPMLLLLCMLYARCLLTLGDDEFYPPQLPSSSQPSKNPLTMDELVDFSAILRNMAFSLIWTDASILDTHVPGTRLNLGEAQKMAIRLLRQLHTRDSRRSFVPKGHWHLLRQQDLASFIKAVVLEERELTRAGNDMPHSILSERTRAFMTPRLQILEQIPFVIPFEVRVEIFRQFVRNDVERLGIARDLFSPFQRQRATIRRGHVAEDGMAQLYALGSRLKEPLEIVFIDQWGQPEAGIDGGGVFKEFLTSIVHEVFNTDRGLWCANDRHELYPSPYSYAQADEQLVWYTFIGRILGKALYEGILVDIKFAGFFLNKWLGLHGYVDEIAGLESLDKDLYRGLIALKNYTGDVENDFSLNFTVSKDEFGEQTVSELIPGGSDIPVTRENRLSYIYHMTRYRLSVQIDAQCRAFFGGLSDLIDPRWLKLLNREELRILLCGTESPIDLQDLRRHTVYGGYHEKDLVVQYFWEALAMMDQSSLKAFLRFVTSSPNPPLLGFGELNPKFAIRHAGDDPTRLPTASTCVNLLKLPAYLTREQCHEKLMYAIHAEAGFDLS